MIIAAATRNVQSLAPSSGNSRTIPVSTTNHRMAPTQVVESFFSTVKSELGERFASHGEAKMALFDYIEVFYNQKRRHSSAGRMSPAAFERR
jgi:transposase InsO family protein